MPICRYCGAENAAGSAFCSLCLARFVPDGADDAVPPQSHSALARARPADDQGTAQAQPSPREAYVSPGDYAALQEEMKAAQQAGSGVAGFRDTAFYQAAVANPGAMGAVQAPAARGGRGIGGTAVLILLYSLWMYLIMLAANFVLSIIALGAAFGGGTAGLSFGIGLMLAADALLLIAAGYWISAKAMERGRGWMYGMACAGAVTLVWQPLVALVLRAFTGGIYTPIFNMYGIFITVFLYLPLGALGGWIAEKRTLG